MYSPSGTTYYEFYPGQLNSTSGFVNIKDYTNEDLQKIYLLRGNTENKNVDPITSAFSFSYIFNGYRIKRKIIECVGDSITVGYNDHDIILSVEGYPQRLNRVLGAKSGEFEFINFGQSGFRPEQYLARWASFANSNRTEGSALVYSIYSPNGYFDNGYPIGASRNTELINNCLLAEQYATQYGRLFIPCFITGTNLFLINQSTIVKDILDWAQNRYGARLLDLHNAIQDQTNQLAPYMASQYTDDQTHPNTAGYDVLGVEAVSKFVSCYNAALIHAGG